MLERDMEDLIANYPEDFFPGKGLKLLARQQSFAGVGRFDLLFEDQHKTKILMELKAGSAKYEVATQLAKYKDELQSRGENNILMWLVALQVTHSLREFLDNVGIEYSEIHVGQFQRVADRHGTPIHQESRQSMESAKVQRPDRIRRAKRPPQEGIVDKSREFIRLNIHRIWDEQRTWVTRDQLVEQLKNQTWAAERLDSDGLVEAEERRQRAGNWVDWMSSQYERGMYKLKDEFEREKVSGT